MQSISTEFQKWHFWVPYKKTKNVMMHVFHCDNLNDAHFILLSHIYHLIYFAGGRHVVENVIITFCWLTVFYYQSATYIIYQTEGLHKNSLGRD